MIVIIASAMLLVASVYIFYRQYNQILYITRHGCGCFDTYKRTVVTSKELLVTEYMHYLFDYIDILSDIKNNGKLCASRVYMQIDGNIVGWIEDEK